MEETKNNWTIKEIRKIYSTRLIDLIYKSATIHRKYHSSNEMQVCTLLSIKTGGCSEDCGYCSQSAHYHTDINPEKLLRVEDVIEEAKKAKESGSTRFCMAAAWREVRNNGDFENTLKMIKGINEMGLEVCASLGIVSAEQADKLKRAGLHTYNHNIDTSIEYYDKVVSTRTFEDRLKTLEIIRNAGINLCCGAILGMGESDDDRISMLKTLANMDKHPESVPINALVSINGTPFENKQQPTTWEILKVIATARILMPKTMIRLSAGRSNMSQEAQTLCFLAGANSIFSGDKLLTTPNSPPEDDSTLFEILGLTPMKTFKL